MKLSKKTWLGEAVCKETVHIEVSELVELLDRGVLNFGLLYEVLGVDRIPEDRGARVWEWFKKRNEKNDE